MLHDPLQYILIYICQPATETVHTFTLAHRATQHISLSSVFLSRFTHFRKYLNETIPIWLDIPNAGTYFIGKSVTQLERKRICFKSYLVYLVSAFEVIMTVIVNWLQSSSSFSSKTKQGLHGYADFRQASRKSKYHYDHASRNLLFDERFDSLIHYYAEEELELRIEECECEDMLLCTKKICHIDGDLSIHIIETSLFMKIDSSKLWYTIKVNDLNVLIMVKSNYFVKYYVIDVFRARFSLLKVLSSKTIQPIKKLPFNCIWIYGRVNLCIIYLHWFGNLNNVNTFIKII